MTHEQRGAAFELWREVERYLNDNPSVTKTELAARAQVSRPTLDRLRDLRRGPDRATVQRIAKAIGLDYNRALRLAGYSESGLTDSQANARRAIQEDPIFNGREKDRRHLLDVYDMLVQLGQQSPTPPAEEEPRRQPPRRRASGTGEREDRRRAG